MELWKEIKGYEGIYEVSSCGRVRSLDRYVKHSKTGEMSVLKKGMIKKPTTDTEGYLLVTLNKDGKYCTKYVHRLVADAFLGEHKLKEQVNHKDENKQNNNIDNLEWCSVKYNINYGTRTARMARTQGKPVSMYDKNGALVRVFCSLSSVKELGYSPSNVKNVCDGKFAAMYGYVWRWA